MSLWDRVVFLGILTVVTTTHGADAAACVLGGSCVLPCSFPPGGEEVLHWIQQVEPKRTVHSFYRGQDQLQLQDPAFRGRTSLVRDQTPGTGTASLQLTGVQVQDQGRFKCYTSTSTGTKEFFYQLNVYAPVRKVDMQQLEDRITCSSQGVYPEPTLTWTPEPRSNETLQNRPSVQQTEQQLYSISSSLDPDPGLDYSCTVSTALSNRTATWFRPTSIVGSHTEATIITCRSSGRPPTGLTWRFNHSHIILNRTGSGAEVSEAWRPHVKIGSEPTSLRLEALSPRQEGLYSCELHDAEQSFTSSFSLRLEAADSPHVAGAAVGGTIGAIFLLGLIAIIGFIIYKSRKKKSSSNGQPERHEMRDLMTSPGEKTEEVEEDEEGDARRGDETNNST